MQPQPGAGRRRPHRLDPSAHRPWVCGAEGVGQGDLAEARRVQVARQADHPVLRHLALERAAEGHRDHHRHGRAFGAGAGDDGAGRRQLGVHACALVGATEAVGGADHHVGLVAPRDHAALPAAHVEHQPDARAARLRRQAGHDLLGARHLRHPARVDEAGRLDPPRARRLQPADELQPLLHRKGRRLVLQAVTRTHLHDLDATGHGAAPAGGRTARPGAPTIVEPPFRRPAIPAKHRSRQPPHGSP